MVENKEISTETPMVVLTNGAVNQLKEIMSSQDIANEYGVRVGVKGGGCSGFSYVLGFDKKEETDEEFYSNGLKIFMNPAHAIYLLGIEIDFVSGLDNRGFTFNNPNAKDTCGCGTSFSA